MARSKLKIADGYFTGPQWVVEDTAWRTLAESWVLLGMAARHAVARSDEEPTALQLRRWTEDVLHHVNRATEAVEPPDPKRLGDYIDAVLDGAAEDLIHQVRRRRADAN